MSGLITSNAFMGCERGAVSIDGLNPAHRSELMENLTL